MTVDDIVSCKEGIFVKDHMFHLSVFTGVLMGSAAIIGFGSHMAGLSYDSARAENLARYVGTEIQLPRGVTAEVTDIGFLGVDVVATDENGNSAPTRISWQTYEDSARISR